MAVYIDYLTDTALNDSDKSFTVPTNRNYTLMGGWAQLIASATVGNRQLEMLFTDGTNTVMQLVAADVQAASSTNQYIFVPGEAAPASAVGTLQRVPFPVITLREDWTIRIYDSAAIDAAADDLSIRLVVKVHSDGNIGDVH